MDVSELTGSEKQKKIKIKKIYFVRSVLYFLTI